MIRKTNKINVLLHSPSWSSPILPRVTVDLVVHRENSIYCDKHGKYNLTNIKLQTTYEKTSTGWLSCPSIVRNGSVMTYWCGEEQTETMEFCHSCHFPLCTHSCITSFGFFPHTWSNILDKTGRKKRKRDLLLFCHSV